MWWNRRVLSICHSVCNIQKYESYTSVRMFVCQHDNSKSFQPIFMKRSKYFSGVICDEKMSKIGTASGSGDISKNMVWSHWYAQVVLYEYRKCYSCRLGIWTLNMVSDPIPLAREQGAVHKCRPLFLGFWSPHLSLFCTLPSDFYDPPIEVQRLYWMHLEDW